MTLPILLDAPNRSSDLFPVVYSTLSGEALVDRVLSQYELDEVLGCRLWNRGLSDIYLVETLTTLYVLRVSHAHWRNQSETQFELEFLDFLRRQDLPVAHPLISREGRLTIELLAPEGKRYAALFIYAPGQIPLGDLNPSQAQSLGQALARIHQAGQKFASSSYRQPLSLDYLVDESVAAIAPFLATRPTDGAYLQDVVDHLHDQLSSLPRRSPCWTVCWGDPHSGNVHFTTDDQPTLFDFDQCGYGWRAFDIAKFFQVGMRAGLSRSVRLAFLAGYEAEQPLLDQERQSLSALTQVAHLWAWSIGLDWQQLHSHSRLDQSYFSDRLAQLRYCRSADWNLG
jgi:Ser/Thr protein kinase RdoA (MazF antagonist)